MSVFTSHMFTILAVLTHVVYSQLVIDMVNMDVYQKNSGQKFGTNTKNIQLQIPFSKE